MYQEGRSKIREQLAAYISSLKEGKDSLLNECLPELKQNGKIVLGSHQSKEK